VSIERFEEAFAYLRQKVESSRIFVLLLGNLGSHHTNISVEIFRGFALADKIAPLAVISDNDAVSAWCFTTLHKVAHLWLGETGVSGWAGGLLPQSAYTRRLHYAEGQLLRTMGPKQTSRIQNWLEDLMRAGLSVSRSPLLR
jgi:hypothetical protein